LVSELSEISEWFSRNDTPRWKVRDERRSEERVQILLLELDDLSYADLMKNGREEAIVYIRGISVTNRFVGCVFVYATEDANPKLVWQYETGDRADGGLRKMDVKDRTLIIEQNTLEGGAGLCCPKKFVRRYFKWNGKEFQNIKSEPLLDEQEN
jgi:hypothetical protein